MSDASKTSEYGKRIGRDGARSVVQFGSPLVAYAFYPGMKLAQGDVSKGLRALIMRRLPWLFMRVVVISVDASAGTVTSEAQRWSWRRWKWEARR